MNQKRRWLAIACLLLPSIACSLAGIEISAPAFGTHDHARLRLGFRLFFGGMTVVPLLIWLLGNLILPSERKMLCDDFRKRRAGRRRKPSIRQLEKAVRYNRFIGGHPNFVLLFCLAALLVCAAMIFGPQYLPPEAARPRDGVLLKVMGSFMGLAYLGILIAYIHARISGKWQPYIEGHIQRSEIRLAQAKALILFEKSNEKGAGGEDGLNV